MKKLCAIISGGRRAPLDGIENADWIIACDKGYQYAEEAGVRPQLLVGDFDSYTGSLPADIPILDLPVEKDDTDTMAAIRYAVQEGYSEIFLYCALGGRLDHLLGNVQSAVFAVERGCRVRIIDTDSLLYFFTDGALTLPPRAGWSLSLLSLTIIRRVSKLCRTQMTMDAMKMIVNALTRKSFAFSHMWMTTDLALGRR